MAECLILGQSGIGKTSLVAELLRRERLAYDLDHMPGMSDWFDADGRPCAYDSDPEWRADHQFLWNMTAIRRLVEERDRSQPLYLAGTAQNDLQVVRFFNQAVVLDASVDTYCQRRTSEKRATPYPVDNIDEYRAWLLEVLPGLRVAWRALGVVILNTSELTTPQVADNLIARVEG
jgi:hypothetical protein